MKKIIKGLLVSFALVGLVGCTSSETSSNNNGSYQVVNVTPTEGAGDMPIIIYTSPEGKVYFRLLPQSSFDYSMDGFNTFPYEWTEITYGAPIDPYRNN